MTPLDACPEHTSSPVPASPLRMWIWNGGCLLAVLTVCTLLAQGHPLHANGGQAVTAGEPLPLELANMNSGDARRADEYQLIAQAPLSTTVPEPQDVPAPPAAQPVAEPAPAPAAVPMNSQVAPVNDSWQISIRPARSRTATVNSVSYRQAYRSVPYSYTEYLANPGYRHEAALEIMFQQLRPMTVQKNYTPQLVPEPNVSPYRPFWITHPEEFRFQYADPRYLWYLPQSGSFSLFGW